MFVALVVNGRPIGAGDTRANERVAASLVQRGDFDLDEYPEVTEPFAVTRGMHRVSIYPALSPVLAAPMFAAARRFFVLDETGSALAGKWAAALLCALSAAILYRVASRLPGGRWPALAAIVFALGTSAASTSQALWQHPAALLFACWALAWMLRAENADPAWAGRVGLPLSLLVAARPADLPLAAVLALATALRWPRRAPWLAAWGAPAAVLALAYQWFYFGGPFASAWEHAGTRFDTPWGVGQAGLLVSPARGLLVFTPVAVLAALGLARAFVAGQRWFAGTLSAAALVHWIAMGRWGEWHGGQCWGPRMLTDALPLGFVFLPLGFAALPRLGWLLSAVSVGVQALGAFAYDYRWERLHVASGGTPSHEELWRVADSPIVFELRERVLILAVPGIRDGRAVVREHRVVPFSPSGASVRFGRGELLVDGPGRLGDAHLQRAARVERDHARLERRWDAVFFRIRPDARGTPLTIRLTGRGRGPLYVGTRRFGEEPRWRTHRVDGSFQWEERWSPEDDGPDVTVTVGRGGGAVDVRSVELVDVPTARPE